ncbi:hypothetical protein Agabi119p4_1723 [Agaricus bisporus var. burnettii]|uniref:Uncharacterized protein n=1 Tax=Agaricus bisporus var. burnettii TaxID=192524 RepID=A0A8H7F7U8_AGABI|nr:hypothetical protein Agabi119p4_1723 [Agaricus bisporus var. burnettii]
MASNNGRYPWELTSLQRGLVDNCFEEGQYETAIATLDQLRSPDFNPHPPHLRQLIYISLQSMQEPTVEYDIDTSVQMSPSKLVKQRQQQILSNLIPAKAVVDAQRLLMAYIRTNSPSVLSRALPRRRSPLVSSGLNEGDSMIAKRASALPSASHRSTRQSRRYGTPNDINPVTTPATIVSESAWPLLNWLVSIYERDEELFDTDLNARHSPLLIEQILDDNGSTYIDAPVTIIAYCLLQKQVQRHQLAGRLLSLLINLTLTVEFDAHALLTAVYTRIQPEQLSVLMAQLGQSTATQVLQFKVGLCQKLIGGAVHPMPGSMTRPQPKMRVRAEKVPDRQAPAVLDSPLLAIRSSIPTFVEILRLLQASAPDMSQNDISKHIWCRYQLLLAYGSLQARLSPTDRDPDWYKALTRNLSIVHDVDQEKEKEARVYQRLLEIQVARWRAVVDTDH